MSLVVNHNLMAMNAARNLTAIYGRLANSVQRLSSGLRVNSSQDDAAGLAIRELMRADIAVLNQGVRNASDAISMIQTAEGGMSVIDEKLTRMKELAEQAATGTYTTAQRLIMDSEYQAMAAEIDRIANATDFNGVKLLDGSLQYYHEGLGMKIHFGTGNSAAEDYYFIQMGDLRATSPDGLRIGQAAFTMRTESLDAATTDTAFATMTTEGYFGIEYTTDGGTTWSLYGYEYVETTDSIDTVMADINAGSAAQGYFTFDPTLTTTGLSTGHITINGFEFAFTNTTTSAAFNGSGAATSIGVDLNSGSWSTLLLTIASFINNNAASMDILASPNLASTITGLYLAAQTFGTVGNSYAVLDGGNTSILISGESGTTTGSLAGGGNTSLLEAGYYYNGTEYELELNMATAHEDYQMRIFVVDALSATSGDVIDSTDTVGNPWGNLPTNNDGSTFVAAASSFDEDSEWGVVAVDWDGAHIRTQSSAQLALAQLDAAINLKDTARANLGATANRLENTITNQRIQAENLQSAESRISDVDVAIEMTEFTRNNIMAQAAVAMLAQANSLPGLALTLLGG